ncbi:MAG: hypothetical protein ABIO14_15105 [Aeromicrobium sp.]
MVFRNGSYGLMQMRAKRPLSDDDSVGEFVKKFQRKLPGPIRQAVEDDVHPFWEDEQLRKFVSRHNKDEEFIDLVVLIHSHRAF